jgi:hypothetical protein
MSNSTSTSDGGDSGVSEASNASGTNGAGSDGAINVIHEARGVQGGSAAAPLLNHSFSPQQDQPRKRKDANVNPQTHSLARSTSNVLPFELSTNLRSAALCLLCCTLDLSLLPRSNCVVHVTSV